MVMTGGCDDPHPPQAYIGAIKEARDRDLATIKAQVGEPCALAGVETFCVSTLRILAKTNQAKNRDVARTVEIAHYMRGQA